MLHVQRMQTGMTRMELLPISAPVYGGGLIVVFLPENYALPEQIQAYLVFKGSKQRHVTKARISLEDNAFHAVVPDHEPPESVEVAVYICFASGDCRCIGAEDFTYYLDQTCYLAKYLADSVHNLESLEDWDYIQGPNFSLEQEDFSTLDERLTSAFQHLILPQNWNILGDLNTAHVKRETLFHFAARLGLSTFVTLLLDKNGAKECLRLKNRHGEFAEDIARDRKFDGLADLVADPHAHGVIRWESKERIGPSTYLKQHSFGSISTTSDLQGSHWPTLDAEFEALNKAALPNTTLPYQLADPGASWDNDTMEDSMVSPASAMYYSGDYESDGLLLPGAIASPDYNTGNAGAPVETRYKDYHYSSKAPREFLADNLNHLKDISDGIHLLRHKDIERLRENGGSEMTRLSTSCPDLAQDMSGYLSENAFNESYESPNTPTLPRNRRALPAGINEDQLEAQMLASDIETKQRPVNLNYQDRAYANADITNQAERARNPSGDDVSPTSLQRRHSWHSAESLGDDVTSPTQKRRLSFQHEGDEETENQDPDPVSPTVRRSDHKNMALFSVVSPNSEHTLEVSQEVRAAFVADGRRSKSLSNQMVPEQENVTETDRRFTISEGVMTATSAVKENGPTVTKADAASGQQSADPPAQLSLAEFLSDPNNFGQKPAAPPRPPAVPPRPDLGPAKKIVTRKLSFLNRMRSGKADKKIKAKSLAELRFGNGHSLPEEDDSYDSVASDAKESNIKSKFKRPSIIRPQSMMINRPAQYSGPHSGYTGGPAKSNARPISNAVNLKVNSSDLYGNNNKSNRSSYYEEEEDGTPPNSYVSSAKDLTSGSMESLDEASDNLEYDNDPDLMLKPDEPDSWSVTADKKVLKKMSKKETKRQDNIYEIIQTERNYLTTLKIMQRIYARGMSKELHMDQTQIERFFPLIDEHVEFVAQFVQKLTERQADKKVVERIGDVLMSQWAGDSGDTMRRLLGEFCCRHNEITSLYKEHMKGDKKFNTFIRKCEKNPHTRRQGIPECALLVTQRITKYPLMVQALLENSKEKDHKEEYEDLTRSLELSKEIAKNIDDQVQDYERQRQLYDIYDRTETKSATSYKDGRKFDRKDLLRRNRKLLYSCNSVQLKIARKFTDVQLLVLSDCIVFLLESGGKYSFPSGQPAVVSLQNLLVREVASSDEKGLFLLSPGSQQMYEMKTSTSDECKTLTQKTRVAVGNCPDEDEGIPSEDEEERRIQELQLAKVRKLICHLEHKDREINRLLADKMGVFQSLAESVERGNSTTRNHYSYPNFVVSSEDDLSNAKQSVPPCAPTLQKALEQVTKLSNAIYGAGGLSRHPSSVGEHDSGTTTTPSLPKRSDTFGGFDNGKEPPSPRTKYMNTSQSDSRLKELEHSSVSESSKRDSGLVDLDITVGRTDSQSSIPKAWPPSNNSSSNNPSPTASQPPDEEFPLLPPTTDQVTALTQLSNLFNSFLSVASQKDTHMERLHLQLMQDRGSITKKRSGTLADAEMKRNQLKQQEQMDDLRRQQQQFKSEREQFNRTNERFQRSIDRERQEMEDEKKQILRSKKEIDDRLEEVTRLKDEQQRELTRLRELQRRSQNEMHTSASSSAISSSASNRNNSSNNLDTIDSKIPLDAAAKSSSALSGSKSFSSLHVSNAVPDPSGKPPASPTYANAADYPRTFPGSKRDSASIVPNPGAGHHQLPIHLQYSATNQVASLQAPKPQTLPLKIATQGKSEKHGVHQIIPSKLSKLASGGQSSGHQHPSSSDPRVRLPFSRAHHKRSSNPEMTSSSSSSSLSGANLQVPSGAAPIGPRSTNHGRLSPSNATNSVSPSRLSDDGSVERSNSSSSSKDGDKHHSTRHFHFNSKHDREESMELFF